jgi:hypothetical protein
MPRIAKLDAAQRQLDASIRMLFKNEDMLAVHTVSRAAFRVLYDIIGETEAKKALTAHMEKVGHKRFNEETNFLKHANQDPGDEIDDNFHVFTEAGIGMAIGLYKGQKKELTAYRCYERYCLQPPSAKALSRSIPMGLTRPPVGLRYPMCLPPAAHEQVTQTRFQVRLGSCSSRSAL